jgi:hypothetical protein
VLIVLGNSGNPRHWPMLGGVDVTGTAIDANVAGNPEPDPWS